MAQTDTQPVPPFRGRATIRDIADLAGVSIATVSRVLNDRPDVARETRESVLQVVREHGFSTNRGARGLSSGRTGMIGLTLPLVADAYFGPMLSGAAEALHERDMRLVLAPTLHEHDREVSLLERLMRGTTDGAILMLPEESEDELLMLQRQGFPFVVVDPREDVPRDIAAVSAAHFAGARSLTGHLVELGHRRIGLLAGPDNWLASNARRAGHNSALADAGVLPDPALALPGEPTVHFGHRAALRLLALPQRPTALVCFNDKAASGALAAAAELGLRVPADLSIAGFDDIDLAQATSPMLTTVRQPLPEMGRIAVSLLIRLLERHRLDALHVELATELIVRGSTGPV
jgi:LacI family transcriptional regulator